MTIHHVGYLVRDVLAAITEFENWGYKTNPVCRDEVRHIDICFIEKDGYTVELIAPNSENSPFNSLLKKYRNSPYHICYVTEHLEEEIKNLCDRGYMIIKAPQEAVALDSKRVCFLMHADIGMIEIVEK